MNKAFLFVMMGALMLAGCTSRSLPPASLVMQPIQMSVGNGTISPSPYPVIPSTATCALPRSTLMTVLSTPTASVTPIPLASEVAVYTIWNPPGQAIAPILLYHHILEKEDNLYTVSIDHFRKQMQTLHDLGYQSIPVSLLVKALTQGAELPPRPVVITFDDGYDEVFTNAFPVLQAFGYTGTVYLIGAYADHGTPYLTKSQLGALQAAGWEFGSHSTHHVDLTKSYPALFNEVTQSKQTLAKLTGTDILTFSFPYGKTDNIVRGAVKESYQAGMGLGETSLHSIDSIFFLSRYEVRRGTSMQDFLSWLPWQSVESR